MTRGVDAAAGLILHTSTPISSSQDDPYTRLASGPYCKIRCRCPNKTPGVASRHPSESTPAVASQSLHTHTRKKGQGVGGQGKGRVHLKAQPRAAQDVGFQCRKHLKMHDAAWTILSVVSAPQRSRLSQISNTQKLCPKLHFSLPGCMSQILQWRSSLMTIGAGKQS